MQGYIYTITSLESGACYVGSTKNAVQRFAGHRNQLYRGVHFSKELQAAFARDEKIEMTVLFICEPSLLRFYERRAIEVLRPTCNTAAIVRDGTDPKVPISKGIVTDDDEFYCTTKMLADEIGIDQRAIQNRILRLRLDVRRVGNTFALTESQAEAVRQYQTKAKEQK